MHCLVIIFALEIILVIFVNGFMDVKLVQSYFKAKMINYASVIECFKPEDKLNLIKSLIFGNQTISFMNINQANNNWWFLKTKHNHIGVIVDADCDQEAIKLFLIQCGKNHLFDAKHHWLLLTSFSNFSKIFEAVELYINADIYVVFPEYDNNLTKYVITDVYNQASNRGGSLQRIIVGYYTESMGYIISENDFKYELRKNMTGVTLKSVIVLPIPFKGTLMDYLQSTENSEINTFNRFHYSVLRPCVKYYNFTPSITLSKSWGYLAPDGTFDGLVGALERKQVDYGSSPLFVRSDRAQVMEYGRRTWTLKAAFIFRNQKSINSINIFIKPFSSSIWISLFFLTICAIIILKYSQLLERKKINKQVDNSWSYLIICATAIFSQQGITNIPLIYSGRITIFFTLILSCLVYQFYSACIVSNLLMKPKTFIKSLEDISKSTMKVGCEDILYNKDYFLYTTDKPSKDIYYQKILAKGNVTNFLPPHDGLVLVKDGGYAFHVELATAYPIIQNSFSESSICELREIQMLRTQPMHANYQKHSPFRDMFDTCLQRLAEYGILQREITFWHPKKPECVQTTKSLTFNLSLEYFYPLYTILVIGIVLSLLILTLELYIDFKERVKKSKKIVTLFPFAK